MIDPLILYYYPEAVVGLFLTAGAVWLLWKNL